MNILLPAGSLMLALCTPALAATAVPAAAPSAPPAGPGRSAFLARSALGDVQLAPDGTALAYLSRSGSAQSLSLLMTAGGKTRILLPETDARRIFWSANARWLFVQSRNLLSAIDITGSATPVPVMPLGPQGPAVLGASPTGPGAAILMERVGERYRLVAIVPGAPGETIYEGPREPLDTAFDPAGRLAWVKFAAGDRHSIERVRADGSLARVAECVRLETCSFVGTADRGRSLLMRSDMGGDLQALVTLGESGAIVRTALDPARAADLRDIVIDPQTQVPLVAAYRSAGARNVGLTADGAARRRGDRAEPRPRQFPAGRRAWRNRPLARRRPGRPRPIPELQPVRSPHAPADADPQLLFGQPNPARDARRTGGPSPSAPRTGLSFAAS